MSDLCQVFMTGRCTRDAELKYTAHGKAVCAVWFASGRKFRDRNGHNQEKTTFVEVEMWGKMAESLHQYLKKGKQLAIRGRLDYDSWEQDGKKRSKLKVTAEEIQLLGGRQEQQGQQPQYQEKPPASVTTGWNDPPDLGESPF